MGKRARSRRRRLTGGTASRGIAFAELDGIKCGPADGVLTVTVPKKEVEEKAAKTARSIEVAECLEDAPSDVSHDTDLDERV